MGFGNTFTAFGVLTFGLMVCLAILMFEIVAKILNMDIFEQSEDNLEMNEADKGIIKQMKEELAMKDFQLESMKTKIEAIKKKEQNICKSSSNFDYYII